MEFSTLSIVSTSSSPQDFWKGAKRLVVIVSTTETDGVLVAYGVDPASGGQVFETSIKASQLGGFFKLLIDGNAGSDPDGIDIPATDPPPPGPNSVVVTAYATAVRADEQLAELGEVVSA